MSSDGVDWLGLLKWSLTYSDGTSSSNCKQMSDDDVQFLQNALRGIKDEVSILKDSLTMIRDYIVKANFDDEDELDNIHSQIDIIRDITDQIDMAEVFVKIGGLDLLIRLFEMDKVPKSLIIAVSAAIGSLAQNHIKVQDAIFRSGIVESLWKKLHYILSVNANFECIDSLASKILYGISGSIRGHAASETFFMRSCVDQIFDIFREKLQFPKSWSANCLDSLNDDIIIKDIQSIHEIKSTIFLQRFLFLSEALFQSNSASNESRQLWEDHWFPGLLMLIFHSQATVRSLALTLIASMISSGHLVDATRIEEIQKFLNWRSENHGNLLDFSLLDEHEVEEVNEELKMIEKMIENISSSSMSFSENNACLGSDHIPQSVLLLK